MLRLGTLFTPRLLSQHGNMTRQVLVCLHVSNSEHFSLLLCCVLHHCNLQKAAMEERVRRKLELQKKKAAEANTFAGSLKGEFGKQKELNSKTKEERRAALCEELGRGC